MAYVPPHARRAAEPSKANGIANNSAPSNQPLVPPIASKTPTKSYNKSYSKPNPQQQLYTRDEIHEHYWPDRSTGAEIISSRHTSSTLNPSATHPDSLRYVVLHFDANPRWESDCIIFVKSHLGLLDLDENAFAPRRSSRDTASEQQQSYAASNEPSQKPPDNESKTDSKAEDTPSSTTEPSEFTSLLPTQSSINPQALPTQPIAVYDQSRRGHRTFAFAGYHRITHLSHLAPRSEALARMMQQKWEASGPSPTSAPRPKEHWGKSAPSSSDIRRQPAPKEREAARWVESMSVPWAVVQFELIFDGEGKEMGLSVPEIEVHEDEGFGGAGGRRGKVKDGGANKGKSVNEMLREMRMGGKENQKPDHGGDVDAKRGDAEQVPEAAPAEVQ